MLTSSCARVTYCCIKLNCALQLWVCACVHCCLLEPAWNLIWIYELLLHVSAVSCCSLFLCSPKTPVILCAFINGDVLLHLDNNALYWVALPSRSARIATNDATAFFLCQRHCNNACLHFGSVIVQFCFAQLGGWWLIVPPASSGSAQSSGCARYGCFLPFHQ